MLTLLCLLFPPAADLCSPDYSVRAAATAAFDTPLGALTLWCLPPPEHPEAAWRSRRAVARHAADAEDAAGDVLLLALVADPDRILLAPELYCRLIDARRLFCAADSMAWAKIPTGAGWTLERDLVRVARMVRDAWQREHYVGPRRPEAGGGGGDTDGGRSRRTTVAAGASRPAAVAAAAGADRRDGGGDSGRRRPERVGDSSVARPAARDAGRRPVAVPDRTVRASRADAAGRRAESQVTLELPMKVPNATKLLAIAELYVEQNAGNINFWANFDGLCTRHKIDDADTKRLLYMTTLAYRIAFVTEGCLEYVANH